MGKRSLRRLLRGRAGRAWSQTTGGRKKALTIDPNFTHLPAHSPTLYVFAHKNQNRLRQLKSSSATPRVRHAHAPVLQVRGGAGEGCASRAHASRVLASRIEKLRRPQVLPRVRHARAPVRGAREGCASRAHAPRVLASRVEAALAPPPLPQNV